LAEPDADRNDVDNDTNTAVSEQPSAGHTFGMVQRDIGQDRSLPPHVKQVYTALTFYAGADRRCFPSQATLAGDTGLSERTVNKAIKQGEAAGLWDVIHTQTSNHYQLRDFGRGYVLGSGPLRTACGPEPQQVQSETAPRADELDQRTRPVIQTSSTSSDAFAAGAPRTSSQGVRRIRIFPLGDLDRYDDGEVTRRLVAGSISALRAAGLSPAWNAADRLGASIKDALTRGVSRADLPRMVEETLAHAGTDDEEWGWLADRQAS
jgi:biotin operon repressor